MENIEYRFKLIPDNLVVDDIKTCISRSESKEYSVRPTHQFSNIFDGRILSPNGMMIYYALDETNRDLHLYGGGFGHGYYHEVHYNIDTLKYGYKVGDSENMKLVYESDSWTELHKFVSDYCDKIHMDV